MKTLPRVSLLVVGLASLVAQPAFAMNFLSIRWTGYQYINFSIRNNLNQVIKSGAGIGLAEASMDGSLDYVRSAGYRYVPRVFCVDVFNFANQSSWAPTAAEWDVAERTGADGETGWRTPVSDDDRWRAVGGLRRAAFLANKYGAGFIDGGPANQVYDKTIALNVAIWKAAYGARFNLAANSGLNANQMSYYNTYIADYDAGYESQAYRWYDNNALDTQDNYQDFLEVVPEPTSLMLLGGVLLGPALLALRRKRL